jgi:hypothetical protein
MGWQHPLSYQLTFSGLVWFYQPFFCPVLWLIRKANLAGNGFSFGFAGLWWLA